MKPLVIVSSKTGNTRVLAHALEDAFDADLVSADAVPGDLSDYNPVFVGFWCDRGMVPEEIEAVKGRLAGKKIGLFATLGGDPGSEWAKSWMSKAEQSFAAQGCEVLAGFLSRGRIDPELFLRMTQMMGGEVTPEREARRRESETHPDRMDIEHLVEDFKKAFA